jgi:hypothetical protein
MPPAAGREAVVFDGYRSISMRKFVMAAVFTFAVIGIVLGDQQNGKLYDVKDGKGRFEKSKGKGKFEDPVDVKFAKDVVVKYATKKKMDITEGDAIEGGLTSDVVKGATSEKSANVIIYIADEDVKDGAKKGEITKVLVLKGKKGGG